MQYEVVIERLTYYQVEASDEDEAVDRAVKGEGVESWQETVNARIVSVGPFQNKPLF